MTILADLGFREVTPGVWVAPEARDVTHPLRGTCEPGCPAFGYCHDFCGEPTGIAKQTDTRQGSIAGRPAVFCRGHNQFTSARSPYAGCWTHRGIPIEKVRPLARWLRDRYGYRGGASVAGLPVGSFGNLVSQTSKRRVTPRLASTIAETVMAHRRPADPFSEYEPVRLAPHRRSQPLRDREMLPAEPLRKVLAGHDRTVLAYQYVAEYGGPLETARQWLTRTFGPKSQANVSRALAERWLSLVDLQLEDVYGGDDVMKRTRHREDQRMRRAQKRGQA